MLKPFHVCYRIGQDWFMENVKAISAWAAIEHIQNFVAPTADFVYPIPD